MDRIPWEQKRVTKRGLKATACHKAQWASLSRPHVAHTHYHTGNSYGKTVT